MSKAVIPNLPPISSIKDPDVRVALDSMWNAWRVRNGDVGDGTHKFLTADDINDALKSINVNSASGSGGNGTTTRPGVAPPNTSWIGPLLGKIDDYIQSSWLWIKLGERIEWIDTPEWFIQKFDNSYGTAIKTETNVRKAADEALAEQITTVSADLGANIAVIQETLTANVTLTQSTATKLTTLQTQFNSNVSSVQQQIQTLTTADAALTNQINTAISQVNNTIAGVQSKVTTLATDQAALTQSVNTQFASVNGNVSLLRSDLKTVSDKAGATATALTQLQTTVSGVSTSAQNALSLATTVEGKVNGAWTVKFDANGYVTGAGLGLEGKNGNYTSSFYVRADKFAIGNPQAPNITPKIPFKVFTTTTTLPDGSQVPPGVYMDEAVVYKLTGTFIDAGTLNAAEIYTGSTWLDRVSGQPILSQAVGAFSLPGGGHYAPYPRWSGDVRFYGPAYHGGAPLKQRLRGGQYGGNVTFLINASSTSDHYFAIWYRINGNDYTTAPVYTYFWQVTVQASYWGGTYETVVQAQTVGSSAVAPSLAGTVQTGYDGDGNPYEIYVVSQTSASLAPAYSQYSNWQPNPQQIGGGNLASTTPWQFIAKTVEPQNDFGTASVAGSVTFYVPNSAWYVDFGVTITDENFNVMNAGDGKNWYVRDVYMTVAAVNV